MINHHTTINKVAVNININKILVKTIVKSRGTLRDLYYVFVYYMYVCILVLNKQSFIIHVCEKQTN